MLLKSNTHFLSLYASDIARILLMLLIVLNFFNFYMYPC